MKDDRNIFLWTSHWLTQNGLPCECLALCDSTNDLAKQNAFTDPAVSVYLADQQAHGRGRGSHTWTSPSAGHALLVSWSFELLFPPQQLSAPIIGLYIYRAAKATWPNLNWSLKAPNDLYLGEKKVAGLLIESVSRGEAQRLIIGLGMNVLGGPADVPIATHIQAQLTSPLERSTWFGFLTSLNQNLRKSIELVGLTVFPEGLGDELFQALKKHPDSGDLTALSPQGDLIYSDRTVSWYEL